jgi:protein TonB
MFNNLIESSSHAKEFKRRGSFLLFTTATYAVLFVVTGVVSIYAYDAHLETQGTELEITFVPLRPTEEEPQPVKNTIRSASNSDSNETRSTRTRLIDSVDNPNNVPPKISTVAESVPPARFDSIIGDRNVDPPTRPGNNRGVPNGTGNNTVVTIPDDPPPPVPDPKPVVHKVLKVSDGVLRGTAILLPQPTYSPIAKQLKIQGTVSVQILIDEQGKVISAEVISGPQMLIHEARRAALQARFTPTKLSGQPVKVSGVITYRFILGQ